jgi:PAS domain S-box-containing protein
MPTKSDKALTMCINITPSSKRESNPPSGTAAKPTSPEEIPVAEVRRTVHDEALFQRLLRILYDGALITSMRGEIIDANVRALEFLLYDKSELTGLSILSLISGADESLLAVICKNLMDRRFTYIEGYCVRKDQSMFPTEVVVNQLRHQDQDLLCFFIRDITRRKTAEDELRRSEAKHLALLDAIPDLIFRMNKDGAIIDFKPAANNQPALPEGEIVGKNIAHVLPEAASPFIEGIRQAVQTGKTQVLEYRAQVGKTSRYYEVRMVANEMEEVLGIVRDITERRRAEEAEKEQVERDFRVARDIQRILLPSVFPSIQGVEISAINIPAQTLGGDYYDLIPVGASHWGIAIADVAGKGVPGALMMAMCRSALRNKAIDNPSPANVLRQVNRAMRPDMQEELFITMIYGVYNAKARMFTFCRAGHESLIVYRAATGQFEMPSPGGMALGLDDGRVFDKLLIETNVTLNKGDLLVFYTDGVTDALNDAGQEFGRDQFLAAIRSCANRSASEITHHIEETVRKFIGRCPQHDDLTLLALRVQP